jgi:hypothetical protein
VPKNDVNRRPPKNRRKQSVEIQGAHGVKMSRHGMKIHCSYYGIEGHNKNGCELKNMELGPSYSPSAIFHIQWKKLVQVIYKFSMKKIL